MTTGEKIQHYRKQIGCSQEELGQKLMVSRQTVSLWEMDKTLPTVDNLLRLKEIFGVSVDEILCGEQPAQEEQMMQVQPAESYTFDYASSGAAQVYQSQQKAMLVRCILGLIAWAFLFVLGVSAQSSADYLILVGVLFAVFLFLSVVRYRKFKKSVAVYQARLSNRIYHYEVYETYFTVEITQNGESVSKGKVYLTEIGRIYESGACLIVQVGGGSYFMRKADLDTQSVFLLHREKQAQKTVFMKLTGWRGTLSVVLMVASICTIWLSGITLTLVHQPYHTVPENMWVFFLFVPIPIASIAFGAYLKGKGLKHKKNTVTGIIMAIMLCVYGSFTFIFANQYTHDEAPVVRVESILKADVPTPLRVNTLDWSNGSQSVQRGYVYTVSDVYFEASAAQAWEEEIANDERWVVSLPNDLVGITSSVVIVGENDYFLVYNVQTEEINTLPAQQGTYRFIAVTYSPARDSMQIAEYEITYQK